MKNKKDERGSVERERTDTEKSKQQRLKEPDEGN